MVTFCSVNTFVYLCVAVYAHAVGLLCDVVVCDFLERVESLYTGQISTSLKLLGVQYVPCK